MCVCVSACLRVVSVIMYEVSGLCLSRSMNVLCFCVRYFSVTFYSAFFIVRFTHIFDDVVIECYPSFRLRARSVCSCLCLFVFLYAFEQAFELVNVLLLPV